MLSLSTDLPQSHKDVLPRISLQGGLSGTGGRGGRLEAVPAKDQRRRDGADAAQRGCTGQQAGIGPVVPQRLGKWVILANRGIHLDD